LIQEAPGFTSKQEESKREDLKEGEEEFSSKKKVRRETAISSGKGVLKEGGESFRAKTGGKRGEEGVSSPERQRKKTQNFWPSP